jgi:hypothetical protein
MNYLVAVLAFSAVMIVLATLATVIVEAFHKVVGARANNFQEMLTKLYADVIVPKLEQKSAQATQPIAEDAQAFVDTITRNPAIQKIGLLRRIPIFKNLIKTKYATDFENLTTRQFIEQFRDTPAAAKIKTAADLEAQKILKHIAYEFERYGQAASMYFQRRATFLSIIASLVLAFTLNIDAISLYQGLANDKALSEKVIAEVNVGQLQKVYEARIQQSGDSNAKLELDKIKQEILQDSAKIEEMGLPIGHAYFPFCDKGLATDFVDTRCSNFEIPSLINLTDKPNSVLSNVEKFLNGVAAVLTDSEGYVWILRTLLTGMLIGLGAPFWFKTYGFIVQFVPGRQAPPEDSLSDRQNVGQAPINSPVEFVIRNDSDPVSEEAAPRSVTGSKANITQVETSRKHNDAKVLTQTLAKKTPSNIQVFSKQGLSEGDLHSILMSDGLKE